MACQGVQIERRVGEGCGVGGIGRVEGRLWQMVWGNNGVGDGAEVMYWRKF